jgi:PadR family transcriptional regulator, regulatory protein PadR
MTKQAGIGQFEQLVLTAIVSLREGAYGVTIRDSVGALASPKNVSLGAVYATLDRLEDKGLIESWLSEPTPERGGRSKRHYRLRTAGERALQESIEMSRRVFEAVESRWGKWPGTGRRWKPAGQH